MESKVALITGAADGIGYSVAEHFSKIGFSELILLDISSEKLQHACEKLACEGVALTSIVVDISDHQEVEKLLLPRLECLGKVNVLVNSAGIALENSIEDFDVWRKIIDINQNGTFTVTSITSPFLQRGGRIINVASILGKAGKIHNTAYCASKHAILGFTKSLALDLGRKGITVNAVLPAWVDTPMLRQDISRQARQLGVSTESMLKKSTKKIPIKRLIQAQEVASTIGFLASDAASAITAQSIVIDGGLLCGM